MKRVNVLRGKDKSSLSGDDKKASEEIESHTNDVP